MKKTIILLSVLVTGMWASCMSEKGMPEPKALQCDSVISYANHIAPLVSSQCLPCHSGTVPAGGLDFSSYEILKAKADDGAVMRTVVETKSMPQPGSGYDLTDEERLKFACWITQGAPNN